MQRVRSFFFVSAGIFLLAAAFHLGATSATAQAPGDPVVDIINSGANELLAVTASGVVYASTTPGSSWQPRGNVFAGGSTPVHTTTFGAVKARYR